MIKHGGHWKGGKTIASNGYVLVWVGKEHHLADIRGYAYEHRMVAEKKIGRNLKPGEIVHHKNGIKTDNKPENVSVVNGNAEHLSHHRSRKDLKPFGADNPMVQCACGCGTWFNAYDGINRPRKYVNGHNPPNIDRQNALIEAAGLGSNINMLVLRTGQTKNAVKTMASKLVNEGKLIRKGRGIYGQRN